MFTLTLTKGKSSITVDGISTDKDLSLGDIALSLK